MVKKGAIPCFACNDTKTIGDKECFICQYTGELLMTDDDPYGGIGIVIKKLRKYMVAVSISNSKVKTYVIPTDEEYMIAIDTKTIVESL